MNNFHSSVPGQVRASAQPTLTTHFNQLQLAPALCKALSEEGYTTPTPIQIQAIPPGLDGLDILGVAQTGTGKTAAFALPILHQLLAGLTGSVRLGRGRAPRTLILSPTRELAAQIGESFTTYGRHTPFRSTVIFGGVGQGAQVAALALGTDILVATPGRLVDLMQQRLVNLTNISFFVLDEADRMLDLGFIQPIRHIAAALPRKRQTLLFSATMPREIQALAESLLVNPVRVSVTPTSTTVERVQQKLYMVGKAQKTQLLVHLLRQDNVQRAVVFTKTKHGADRVVKKLRSVGLDCDAIHGNKAQNHRTRTLEAFRTGAIPVLVATDLAARGLDVDGITHVFNHDLPMEPEAYVHRIGRTARAGASGIAISFCDNDERGLLKDIERITRITLDRVALPPNLPTFTDAVNHDERPERVRGVSRNRDAAGPRQDSRGPNPNRSAQPSREQARPAQARPPQVRSERETHPRPHYVGGNNLAPRSAPASANRAPVRDSRSSAPANSRGYDGARSISTPHNATRETASTNARPHDSAPSSRTYAPSGRSRTR